VIKAWVNEADVRERGIDLKNGATLKVDFPGK
jgi:hypothetical protein